MEIVVIDDLTDSTDNKPIVKVDGTTIDVGFFSGAWYGYFAATEIQDTGLFEDDDNVIVSRH